MHPLSRTDALPEAAQSPSGWDESQPVRVDAYKALVWAGAIATPWLVIVTIALVSLRVLG